MKILITADLHYEVSRSREAAKRLAEKVCAAGGDVLVLVGDTAGAKLGPMREALAQLGQISGQIITEDILGRIFARFCVGK